MRCAQEGSPPETYCERRKLSSTGSRGRTQPTGEIMGKPAPWRVLLIYRFFAQKQRASMGEN
jgi:hypothetical protein